MKLRKHSPEILVIAGVMGTIASVVTACRATMRLEEVIDDAKENIDKIHTCLEDAELKDEYSVEDSKKDFLLVYTRTGVELAKLYAPAIILGTLSIASILSANAILRKRNVAIAAAYATTNKCFKEYRGRVIERFGEEIDKELKYDIREKTFEETIVDRNGKEKTIEKKVKVTNGLEEYSEFARFFDASSRSWDKDPEYNLLFLKAQQTYANNKLQADGYLFLNDAYDLLDIPKTKEGQVVGWIYDKDNPDVQNLIDFGIYDINRVVNRDFVNGYEPVILLDFNIDGNILDCM